MAAPDAPSGGPAARTLPIRNAACVATRDDARRELRDASLRVRGHRIAAIGPAAGLPQAADEVVDARSRPVAPGLIDTRHRMHRSLTRAIPGVQDAELFFRPCRLLQPAGGWPAYL